jgi:hypothetical protein
VAPDTVVLSIRGRQARFLYSVTRDEYHFVTDEEQAARQSIGLKLEGMEQRPHLIVTLTQGELRFLLKICRENFSFITQAEKDARRRLAAYLQITADRHFGKTG